jgi:hypothetical protein
VLRSMLRRSWFTTVWPTFPLRWSYYLYDRALNIYNKPCEMWASLRLQNIFASCRIILHIIQGRYSLQFARFIGLFCILYPSIAFAL